MSKVTMSTTEVRERVEGLYDSGTLSAVDLRAIERYLDKVEYRSEYNRRPEVKAKRKEYNEKRRQEEKQARQLLEVLRARAAERGEK